MTGFAIKYSLRTCVHRCIIWEANKGNTISKTFLMKVCHTYGLPSEAKITNVNHIGNPMRHCAGIAAIDL